MLRLSLSLLLLSACSAVVAQIDVPEEDTVAVKPKYKKPDSLKEKTYFRAIRVGTDVLALALSRSDSYDGWEVNVDTDFGPFYLAGDYGFASRDEILETGGTYHTTGNYWRAGVDVNILKQDTDRNMLFFGLRYAHSSSSELLNYNGVDPVFGPVVYQVTNPALTGSWGELVTGLRVKLWKEFWMGFTCRLKIMLAVRGTEDLTAYYIPGYGVIGSGATWGFNYQVFWRIPYHRQKKPG